MLRCHSKSEDRLREDERMSEPFDPFLENGLVIFADKGGAGKSRLAAEVAAAAAEAGWRVLAVDLDYHHGLGGCLGYDAGGLSDEGKGLYDAVVAGAPLNILKDVCGRPGLDVVPAGQWTRILKGLLSGADQDLVLKKELAVVLAEEAVNYDLVVFDTRPDADDQLFLEVIAVSAFVAGATKMDNNDLEAVRRLRALVDKIHRKRWNERLELLGVAVIGWPRERNNATTKYRTYAEGIEAELGVRPFTTPICEATMAIIDMIRRGMTSGEYARAIEKILLQGGTIRSLEREGYLVSVAGRRVTARTATQGRVVGGVELGGGLASDCFELTQEILQLIRARADEAAAPPETPVGEYQELVEPALVEEEEQVETVLVLDEPDAAPPMRTWDTLLETEGSL
jgi:cellulose biosynthesis protein BcsQ